MKRMNVLSHHYNASRMRAVAAAGFLLLVSGAVALAQPAPKPPDSEKLRVEIDFLAGYGHDGAQAALGFEKQGRVGRAAVTLSGRPHERFRYRLSFNPVNEASSKPACGEANFFFPNDPRVYSEGPVVPCDPESGHKRVDTYNTYALDYIVQQGPLREGYVDWLASDRVTARFGRFIVPIGFAPEEVGSWSSKDMTRIQRLNAEANFGLMLGYAREAVEVAAIGVLGEGNREKDYDWFYFADPTLDTNSALTAFVTARVRPHPTLDLRAAYKKGFTGSKVERLPSYWASKRNDDAVVVSANVNPHPVVSLFGEWARYKWGPTATSAELLEVDQEPIYKAGYYVGARVSYPIRSRVVVGTTITREEISRDDSLIKYLAHSGLYGVEMGKKDRALTARFFVTVFESVTAGLYWSDVSNPYPWVSGSWPVSGPQAFSGRAPDRYGLVVSIRAPLFP
jgi:hypothetical protein